MIWDRKWRKWDRKENHTSCIDIWHLIMQKSNLIM
jgi:hypothetical protein